MDTERIYWAYEMVDGKPRGHKFCCNAHRHEFCDITGGDFKPIGNKGAEKLAYRFGLAMGNDSDFPGPEMCPMCEKLEDMESEKED